jgi:hypothetical protein
MSTPKHRLSSEAHALRTYAIVRRADGRVMEVFCTRAGARFYREGQVREGHWRMRDYTINPGWFTPEKERPNV